ncbi:MAG: iron ABC transporter permease [Burkholderiales bacterium]|nr:iron ABC transporter permease [Burkholderiales bacterium]
MLIAALVVAPLVVLLTRIGEADPALLEHLLGHVLPSVGANTLELLGLVVAGTAVLGASLAWLVSRYRFPGRDVFSWALILPMALPAYVLAFVTVGLLDFAGPLQTWLRTLLGPDLRLPPVRSLGGAALVLVLSLYPYVYLLCRNAFDSQGQRAMEAARSLGLSRRRAFWRVALPMSRPWLAAGLLLVTMETLADFGTVSVFNVDTFTTAIYKSWFGLFSLGTAAQLASVLLIIGFAIAVTENRLRDRAGYWSPGRGRTKEGERLSGGGAWLASAACSSVLLLAFVLPLAQLALWAVSDPTGLDTASLRAAGRTLLLGLSAAALVVTMALLLAYARRESPGRVTHIAIRLATLGYAIPGAVLAVGVFVALSLADRTLPALAGIDWRIGGTLVAILLAYVARFLAVGFGPVEAGMARIGRSLDEAARVLGAGNRRRLLRVHLPLLAPSLFSAAALVLVDVMKEMPITLMTRPFGWDTLAVRIFELTSEGQWEAAALPSLALVATGLLPLVLLNRQIHNAT